MQVAGATKGLPREDIPDTRGMAEQCALCVCAALVCVFVAQLTRACAHGSALTSVESAVTTTRSALRKVFARALESGAAEDDAALTHAVHETLQYASATGEDDAHGGGASAGDDDSGAW